MSQHLTIILLYPTAVASYACYTALVSRSLLDDKDGASRLLDETEGIFNSACKALYIREFQPSKAQTKYQPNQTYSHLVL